MIAWLARLGLVYFARPGVGLKHVIPNAPVLLLLLRDDYSHYTTILLATPCHPRQKITLACFRLGIVLGGPDIGLTATAVNGDAPVMCEMVCYRRFVYYSESILASIDTFTPGNH